MWAKQSCHLLPPALVANRLTLILAKLHLLGGFYAGRVGWFYLAPRQSFPPVHAAGGSGDAELPLYL